MVLRDNLKITIVGSSVSLRIRPSLPVHKGLNFGQIIEKRIDPSKNVTVTNLGLSRMLITEVEYNLDTYIRTFPNLYIINIGAVDAPNREVPLWYSNYIFKRKSRFSFRCFNWVHKNLLLKIRTSLVRIRRYKPWVSSEQFINEFKNVINNLQKETDAKIIVLGINEGNEKINSILPRTSVSYIKYNEHLKKLTEDLDAYFIDVSDLTSENHYPDGVHYNEQGHEVIGNRIIELWRTIG